MYFKMTCVLIVFCVCTGCSTLSTLSERSSKNYPYTEMTNECKVYEVRGIMQQPVYSGSRSALLLITLPWTCSGDPCSGVIFYPLYLPFSLLDLSFSVIADTVVLPYTYNLQFNECPNVNWPELAKKRELLTERIRLYYSDYLNPKHIWELSSKRLKGKKSTDEFIKYLYDKDIIVDFVTGKFVTEIMSINKNEACVLIYNDSKKYTVLPWYDYWVYEDANWYIDRPNSR